MSLKKISAKDALGIMAISLHTVGIDHHDFLETALDIPDSPQKPRTGISGKYQAEWTNEALAESGFKGAEKYAVEDLEGAIMPIPSELASDADRLMKYTMVVKGAYKLFIQRENGP